MRKRSLFSSRSSLRTDTRHLSSSCSMSRIVRSSIRGGSASGNCARHASANPAGSNILSWAPGGHFAKETQHGAFSITYLCPAKPVWGHLGGDIQMCNAAGGFYMTWLLCPCSGVYGTECHCIPGSFNGGSVCVSMLLVSRLHNALSYQDSCSLMWLLCSRSLVPTPPVIRCCLQGVSELRIPSPYVPLAISSASLLCVSPCVCVRGAGAAWLLPPCHPQCSQYSQ